MKPKNLNLLVGAFEDTDDEDLQVVREVVRGKQTLKTMKVFLSPQAHLDIDRPFYKLLDNVGYSAEATNSYNELMGTLSAMKRHITRVEKAAQAMVRFNQRQSI
jgi:hypothetical protein